MDDSERSLVENVKHKYGKCGGFCFASQQPDLTFAHRPMSSEQTYPNGAKTALLLTFDVEGQYGNGTGSTEKEVQNYKIICEEIKKANIKATFNIVGQMADEHGPEFVQWMVDSGSEIAPHGYIHDLNKKYGGEDVYAGHYGKEENLKQIMDGIAALEKICPGQIKGFRLPYCHFNEFSYDALEEAGLIWASHVNIEDFLAPGQGYGPMPFQIKLDQKLYPIVEIPLDSQTYDWAIWIADEESNHGFVESVRRYCVLKNIPFDRSPKGAFNIWKQRAIDAMEAQSCFTFLCHPNNLAVKQFDRALEDFMIPFIQYLGTLQANKQAWVCSSAELSDFYISQVGIDPR